MDINDRIKKFKKYSDLREEIFSKEEQKELDFEIKGASAPPALQRAVLLQAKKEQLLKSVEGFSRDPALTVAEFLRDSRRY